MESELRSDVDSQGILCAFPTTILYSKAMENDVEKGSMKREGVRMERSDKGTKIRVREGRQKQVEDGGRKEEVKEIKDWENCGKKDGRKGRRTKGRGEGINKETRRKGKTGGKREQK